MIYIRETTRAIRIVLLLWLVAAIIYPSIVLTVGQTFFKPKANGSIIQNINGEPIGSALIGQQFTEDKYFHGRPSAVDYAQADKGKPRGISGGSNLSPGNSKLLNRIKEELEIFAEEDMQPFPELIYTSGSGLDPHISIQAARNQLERVASARDIRPDEVFSLLKKYTDKRFFGIFGEPGVNILKLNYALDLQDFNRNQN
ncbi:K(+)-transporting ATPase subunit C [Calothrix rhizosoleniae]|uniref:K(+)-transporting ATPase subunit C n=1 Tax=Calothrix rhizosoleniae TaxID=888997 RepID=UPI000B49CA83|nr:K(+)-transporting ATPase subunit C [Calothrix rhizosoleniae]